MYTLHTFRPEAILQITIDDQPSLIGIQTLREEIIKETLHFADGHKTWVVVNSFPSQLSMEEFAKIDLAAYTGKRKGLKQLVVQLAENHTGNAEMLHQFAAIYQGMNIPFSIVYDEIEARKKLGFMW